jgi:thiosulfate reductase cytochrome b subunit
MNRRGSNIPRWTCKAVLVLGLTSLFIVLCHTANTVTAQDQGSNTPTPATSEAAANPAETPAKSPEATSTPPEPKPQAPTQEPKPLDQPQASAAANKAEPEELSNEQCMECHNSSILKLSKQELEDQVVIEGKPVPAAPKAPFFFGELNLAIRARQYNEGVHADTTCVTCHKDIAETPHQQRVKPVRCKECHEESVAAAEAGAHRTKIEPNKAPAPGCIGCHNVHYGKGADEFAKDFRGKICIDCHKAYGMPPEKGHKNIYEFDTHLKKLECIACHRGKQRGVHGILPVKEGVARCQSCHTRDSILSKEKKAGELVHYIQQTHFINADAMKKFAYVIGANRIPALDTVIILIVLAPLGLPVAHGGLRFLTRRKGPLHLPEEKILLHPLTERIWHWFQAVCVVMLIITGAMLHWPEKFPGCFDWAVTLHNWFGILMILSFFMWLIYNLVTRRMSHYIPQSGEIPGGMLVQAQFYAFGIFKHEPHPFPPTEDNKFNPLQKITYLMKQLVLVPILLISGVLYMYPDFFKAFLDAIGGLKVLAIFHLLMGAVFASFLMAHLYLATTGETIGENFKAMIFGYGIKSEHGEHKEV